MGHVVMPLWQLSPRKNGALPAQQGAAQPADVRGVLCVGLTRQAARPAISNTRRCARIGDPQLAMFRVAMMPPKSSGEAVAIMRTAFVEMWKSPQFLADYSKVIKTEPILVTGAEGQEVLSGLAHGVERDQGISRQIHGRFDQQVAAGPRLLLKLFDISGSFRQNESSGSFRQNPSFVMAGHSRPKDGVASLAYDPAIHALLCGKQGVDARDKRGHDGRESSAQTSMSSFPSPSVC